MDNCRLNKLSWLRYILLVILLSACKPQKISFVPLTQFDYEGTKLSDGKKLNDKGINFIVINYKNNVHVDQLIDSVAFANINSVKNYDNYNIIFYKSSDKTNLENLKANPRDIDRYSQEHDLIYQYSWITGKYVGKVKYRNGKMVGAQNIGVE